jgi:hypothetical protein
MGHAYVLVPRRHWWQLPQAAPGSAVEWAPGSVVGWATCHSLHAHLCLDVSFFCQCVLCCPLVQWLARGRRVDALGHCALTQVGAWASGCDVSCIRSPTPVSTHCPLERAASAQALVWRRCARKSTTSDRHPGQWRSLRREGNALQLRMEMRGVSLGPNMQSTDARALVCTP